MHKMENSIEEFEDALSFCDLSLHDDQEIGSNLITEYDDLSSSSSTQEFFEFSSAYETNSTVENIIFCGKVISCNGNDDQRKYPSTNKKAIRSFPSSATSLPQRPKNFRCPSSGNSGKKHKVMLGLAKIPSKLELSDLRERQNRRTPPPMLPSMAADIGKSAVVSGNGSSGKSRSWGLLRPFRYRDLINMLARSSSLRCLRLARPCFD